jgi:hypothetical protein
MGGGHAEDGHHRVADELLDRAALALDLLRHRLEVVAHHRPHVLRVHLLGARGRADDVGEEDRDELERLGGGPTSPAGSSLGKADEKLRELLFAEIPKIGPQQQDVRAAALLGARF